jgi:sec-independent protein translocase protein TatA
MRFSGMYFLAFGMPAAPEWIFIGILALILFGPKKLPELAKGLGKALGELQKAKEDFHREITGVPPLPKIEPPKGLQGLQPASSDDPAPKSEFPSSGDTKA